MLPPALIFTRFSNSALFCPIKFHRTIAQVFVRQVSVSVHDAAASNAKTKQDPDTIVKSLTSNPKLQSRLKPIIERNPQRLEWTPIYRFRYIVLARSAQKAKIGQTFITCCLVLPMCTVSYLSGHSELETVSLALGISTFAMMMLYIVGTLSSRLIGAVYVDKDPKKKNELIVSTLSFWGNRVDKIVPRDSFVHFCDLPDIDTDAFLRLQYADPDSKESPLYLSLRFGTVENQEEFESVFGVLSPSPKRAKAKVR